MDHTHSLHCNLAVLRGNIASAVFRQVILEPDYPTFCYAGREDKGTCCSSDDKGDSHVKSCYCVKCNYV